MKNGKLKPIFILFFFFILGGVIWKFGASNKYNPLIFQLGSESKTRPDSNKTIVMINNEPIKLKEMEWEYQLLTKSLLDDSELNISPKDISEDALISLKKNLLSEIIERKVMYNFIKKDLSFDSKNKNRFKICTSQLQQIKKENEELINSDKDALNILENRLCETSIINQYIQEKIRPSIQISQNEIQEYYINNKESFNKPARITVRQIVLADENTAKKVRREVTKDNFQEMAKNYSIAPEPEQNGIYGPIERGEYANVFDAGFRMREGQISDVLKSAYGYHIIMIVEKFSPGLISLSDAEVSIRQTLIDQKFSRLYEKFVEEALAASTIKSEEHIW